MVLEQILGITYERKIKLCTHENMWILRCYRILMSKLCLLLQAECHCDHQFLKENNLCLSYALQS